MIIFKMQNSRLILNVLLACFVVVYSTASQGQDLYWDANGNTAGTGGTGTWTTAGTWRSGSETGTLGNWTDSRDAYFGARQGSSLLEVQPLRLPLLVSQ